MSFYQHSTISLYSWFLLVLSCNIFLMTFHRSIFLNIKLGLTTTSSPRRLGRGLHNPDSSHDQIWCFWLAEVRNFTNIMIEWVITSHMAQWVWLLIHAVISVSFKKPPNTFFTVFKFSTTHQENSRWPWCRPLPNWILLLLYVCPYPEHMHSPGFFG